MFFSTKKYYTGIRFNDTDRAEYNNIPVLEIPKERERAVKIPCYSLKQLAPFPGNQGETCSCAAWACAYTALTIRVSELDERVDRKYITQHAFSPGFVYRALSNDPACRESLSLREVLLFLKKTGAPEISEKEQQFGITQMNITEYEVSTKKMINDFQRAYGDAEDHETKIQKIKYHIAGGNAVIISVKIPESFKKTKMYWNPEHGEKLDKDYELHGLCVIGYNDDEQVFEIQNSWGVQWGHQGYAFVGYTTLMEYIQQAFVLI